MSRGRPFARAPRPLALALGVGALLAACGGPRLLVRGARSAEIAAPPPERAQIVLAMPGSDRDVVTIVDERGRYLGQLGSRTWSRVEVEPGARRLYALVGASAYVVGGTVEGGRTYWAIVETPFARPMRWVAAAPTCEEGRARIGPLRAVEPDPDADRTALERQLGDVPQRILEADRELEAMTTEQRAQRALRASSCEAWTSAQPSGASPPESTPPEAAPAG